LDNYQEAGKFVHKPPQFKGLASV